MPQDLKHRTEDLDQTEASQGQQFASNPQGTPGTPSRRKNRKFPARVQPERGGALDPFTSQLVAWVVGGCGDADWRSLLARKREAGAPPWLDGENLGLDDLSHRILLLAIAHLVHTQGAIELSPFEGREDLDGECLIKHLALPAPAGSAPAARSRHGRRSGGNRGRRQKRSYWEWSNHNLLCTPS